MPPTPMCPTTKRPLAPVAPPIASTPEGARFTAPSAKALLCRKRRRLIPLPGLFMQPSYPPAVPKATPAVDFSTIKAPSTGQPAIVQAPPNLPVAGRTPALSGTADAAAGKPLKGLTFARSGRNTLLKQGVNETWGRADEGGMRPPSPWEPDLFCSCIGTWSAMFYTPQSARKRVRKYEYAESVSPGGFADCRAPAKEPNAVQGRSLCRFSCPRDAGPGFVDRGLQER